MADLALTAAQIALVFPQLSETYTGKAVAAITPGQVIYQLTDGTFGVADANDSGKEQARGIALEPAAAGQHFSYARRGWLYGYTLTSQTWDDQLFLSNTAGALSDSVGAMTVPCGRVMAVPGDSGLAKVVYVEFDWVTQWS